MKLSETNPYISRIFGKLLQSRVAVGTALAGLAIAPRLPPLPGLRLLDDPVWGTLIVVFLLEVAPFAGFGFLLLLAYAAVGHLFDEETSTRTTVRSLTGIFGLGIGIAYSLFSLALWIDPWELGTVLVSGVHSTGQWLLTTPPFAWIIPWHVVIDIENSLHEAIWTIRSMLVRPPNRPVRWPFYLFVAYLAVSEITNATDWLAGVPQSKQLVVKLVAATVTLTYALIFTHNLFPGLYDLPWEPETTNAWLALHTAISLGALWLLRPITGRDARSAVVGPLVVLLLLGIAIAIVDTLYPIPELLVVGSAVIVLIDRYANPAWLRSLEARVIDLESRFVDGLAVAWSDPTRLFELIIVFQSFWIWWWPSFLFVTAIYFDLREFSLVVQVLVFVLISPMLVASAYALWFWIGEIQRLPDDAGSTDTSGRFPDLLVFPMLVLISYFLVIGLIEENLLIGLLAIAGVLIGLVGMVKSVREFRYEWTLPDSLARHSILVAFFVQSGGLGLAAWLVYGAQEINLAGIGDFLPFFSLVALYFYPHIRRKGLGPFSPFSSSLSLVGLVSGGLFLYHVTIDPVSWGNVFYVTAVALAGVIALQDLVDRNREFIRFSFCHE